MCVSYYCGRAAVGESVTTKGHMDVPGLGLPPGTTLMSEGHAGLAMPLTSCSTQKTRAYTLLGKHSGAGPGCRGEGVAGELALTLADLVVARGRGRDTSPPHYSLTACGRLESWFHPSAAAALGRAHSTPDLGSPAELALEAWA